MTERYQQYFTYLQSDHWAALRKEKKRLAGRNCQVCKSSDIRTVVHHIRYRDLYDCGTDDLLVMCQPCHNSFHHIVKGKRLKVEDFDLCAITSLLSQFKKTDEHVEREAKLKIRRRLKSEWREAHPSKHKLSASERKRLQKEILIFNSERDVQRGAVHLIAFIQTLHDARNY